MQVPNILEYTDYQNFLKDFFECNKNENSPMSYRYLAGKLNWSASNINEIIHGKRTLNVQRALELSRFLKMDTIQTERLIYLTMKESSTDEVKGYFDEILKKQFSSEDLVEKNLKLTTQESLLFDEEKDVVDDFSAILLYGFLRWCNGKTTHDSIVNLLYTGPQFRDFSHVIEKLHKLERKGMIKIISASVDNLHVEILKYNLCTMFDRHTIFHMANYTDNMSRILRNPNLKGFFNSGIIKIRRERVSEAKFRITMLRNWLLEVEAESFRAGPEDNILFQYDLSLGTAIDVNALGINNLTEWLSGTSAPETKVH